MTLRRLACAAAIAIASIAPALPAQTAEDLSLKRIAHPEPPDAVGIGRMIPDLTLTAFDNSQHSLAAITKDKKATVICATSVTCPMSIRYAPRLSTMAREYESRGVRFILLNVSDTDTIPEIREQANRISWPGLSIPDTNRQIRATLNVRTTTEVFVLDPSRTLVYRGALDDQYGVGTALPSPRSTWVRNALDAMLESRPITIPATWPPGCIVETPVNAKPIEQSVTYHNRISRILQNRCMDCHRVNGGAPFRLDSYEAISGRSSMIKLLVEDGLMPPWHAVPAVESELSPWANDRSLTPSERADLLAWLNSDRPLGDAADAPPLKRYPAMWVVPKPDLTLTSPTMAVPAGGALRYAPVMLPTNLQEDRWVTSIELRPMGHGIFHHALVYILPTDPSKQEPDDVSRDFVGQFGMGDALITFPRDAAWRLPAGARLLIHAYFLSGQQSSSERFTIAFKFTGEQPLAEVKMHAPTVEALTIPAGIASHEISATTTLDSPAIISAFSPAMRSRGASIRYEAHLPDGTSRTLLDVPAYDFRWRERYIPRDPINLPTGTRLQVTATFNNSSANPNNPFPEHPASWGWGVENDVMLGYFETLSAR